VATIRPEPIDSTEACEYKLIEKIKKANEWNLHPGEVHVVVGGGEHITPTAADYVIWAHLVVRLLTQHHDAYHSNSLITQSQNLATIDKAPTKLNLGDHKPKKPLTDQENSAALQQVSNQHPVRKSSLPTIPSSDDGPDFTTNYPWFDDWLRDLDEHAMQGQDQQNYLQWASFLMAEGYIQLDDFQQIKSEELHQICEGMNRGTASRLLAYTKEDVERLDKESRRACKHTREF
jgi:hypothetical protein